MAWQPIDFQSIILLGQGVIPQLDQYLNEKEARLAVQISNSVSSDSMHPFSPVLPNPLAAQQKLSEAVEGLTKKVRLLGHEYRKPSKPGINIESISSGINTALWEMTDILEGCVIELFNQIKQVSIDKWNRTFAQVVQSIKEILVHRIDDLSWVVKRLQGSFDEYQQLYGIRAPGWRGFLGIRPDQIDKGILTHLNQSEQLLKTRYESFHQRYLEYTQLSIKVEDQLQKMKGFPVLALLEIPQQNLYVDVFRLLTLLDLNPQPKKGLGKETVRALKNLSSVDGVIHVFGLYFYGLKRAFFNCSLELKALSDLHEDQEKALNALKVKVKDYVAELQHLMIIMAQYREFMLQTDSNPYVRSRWGFTERTVAPEPAKARDLRDLIFSCEELKRWYEGFQVSLGLDPTVQQQHEDQSRKEIGHLLHEMTQPLISQHMMRNRAKLLLEQLMICDEVGSPHQSTIQYVQDILSKALRADWKYHVLHEFSLFHELYRLHEGLIDTVDDPAHSFRLEQFHRLFEQIQSWMKKDEVYSHIHEVEMDMSDMKTYLQDFLAAVQRAEKDKSSDPFLDDTIGRFSEQLLEYRYVFGEFFAQLTATGADGQQLRNQFLFVDQYFESIESLIQELMKK